MRWLALLGADQARADEAHEADVRAEIEHHLALATEALVEEGLEPEAAAREARRRFGDPERVRRACLWIRNGGRTMLRRLHIALTAALALAVVVLALHSFTERARLRALAEQSRMVAAEHLQLARAAEALAREERARREGPFEQVVIGVGDRLALSDAYHPERDGVLVVQPDGEVLLKDGPGWVHVAGLTRAEAEATLRAASAPYYDLSEVYVQVLADDAQSAPR